MGQHLLLFRWGPGGVFCMLSGAVVTSRNSTVYVECCVLVVVMLHFCGIPYYDDVRLCPVRCSQQLLLIEPKVR